MTEATPALLDRPSMAVLPLQSLCDDPEQEYFADGVVEEIITGLVCIRLRAISIRSTRKSLGWRLAPKSLRAIGASPAVHGQMPKAKSWAAHPSVNLLSLALDPLGL
jgi:TolB-like protein